MKDNDKAKEIANKWWQDLIKKENCNSTEEAIEKACLEMAEYKDKMFGKSIKFLEEAVKDNHSRYVWYYSDGGFCGIEEEFIDDFKNAMREN